MNAAQWWANVRSTAPSGLAGLWFGLVELAKPASGWHLYVAGTEEFDGDDETGDWAAGDYAWWPPDDLRYFPVPEVDGMDEQEALEHAAAILQAIEPWNDVPVEGAAVGFDDGDLIYLHVPL